MVKASTRGKIAAIYSLVSPVASSSASIKKPLYGKLSFSDPFSLAESPFESDIQESTKILNDARKAGRNPTGVKIEGNG